MLLLGNMEVLFINTMPRDVANGGRVEAILRCLEGYNQHRVRNFLRDYRPKYALVSECLRRNRPKGPVPRTPFVLLSRYCDNVYYFFGTVPPSLLDVVKNAVSSLLHVVYGIC